MSASADDLPALVAHLETLRAEIEVTKVLRLRGIAAWAFRDALVDAWPAISAGVAALTAERDAWADCAIKYEAERDALTTVNERLQLVHGAHSTEAYRIFEEDRNALRAEVAALTAQVEELRYILDDEKIERREFLAAREAERDALTARLDAAERRAAAAEADAALQLAGRKLAQRYVGSLPLEVGEMFERCMNEADNAHAAAVALRPTEATP